jgi:hypothetical protein
MDPHVLTHTLRTIRAVDSPEQARRREHRFLLELELREARRLRSSTLVCRTRNAFAAVLPRDRWATRLACATGGEPPR